MHPSSKSSLSSPCCCCWRSTRITKSRSSSRSSCSRWLLSVVLCLVYNKPASCFFAIAFVGAIHSNNNNHASTNSVAPTTTTTRLFGVEQQRGGSTAASSENEEIIPVDYIAESDLPTDMGAYRLRAYRVSKGWEATTPSPTSNFHEGLHFGKEPCVIYYADKPPGTLGGGGPMEAGVPVRIHDQCFTSEVFRSQRCDCKEQLQMALHYIQEHGGAIIYLQQEGRGIGLANKVAAYALQDGGMDTVDANIHLGFPEDARQYGMVPSILKNMGISSIQLMTNNPKKTQRLRALGIAVDDIIPMVTSRINKHNRKYLETKVVRMNHTSIGAMLTLSSPDTNVHNKNNNGLTLDSPTIIRKNGNMAPHKSHPKNQPPQQPIPPPPHPVWIYEGATKAAKAVAQALLDEQQQTMTGVSAKEDGYCFGKQSVEDAIAAIQRGEMVVVVDDENRENEGDFIIPAAKVTPQIMATMIRFSSGVVCVAMESDRMEELGIHPMVQNNQDPKGTAFGVSVDAKYGISTGISATDRATTIQLLANPLSQATDFYRPGHVFPLCAREGGTLVRDGHTEASVDLSKLAGLPPCGVLVEIVSEENPVEMARLPELKRFCQKYGFIMTSIVDIAQYRREMEQQQK